MNWLGTRESSMTLTINWLRWTDLLPLEFMLRYGVPELLQYRLEGKAIAEPKEGGSSQTSEEKEGQEASQQQQQEQHQQQEDGERESEVVRELKASLKSVSFLVSMYHCCCSWLFCLVARKSQESQKEMKLLLDVYKGLAKEQREKVEVCPSGVTPRISRIPRKSIT